MRFSILTASLKHGVDYVIQYTSHIILRKIISLTRNLVSRCCTHNLNSATCIGSILKLIICL